MVEANDAAKPAERTAETAGQAVSPSRAVNPPKRTNWIMLLVAVVLAMYYYYNLYLPPRDRDRVRDDLWRAAQVLDRPAHWEGVPILLPSAPIAVGEFRTSFPSGVDPVDSLWDWLSNLDLRSGMPTDPDELRRRCFSGNACSWDFTYDQRYLGRILIYISRTTSGKGDPLPNPVAEIRYEMWAPM